MFSLDFLTIGILFGILALLGYLVYAIRGVLAERVAEETLFVETPNMHFIPFTLNQLQSALLGSDKKAGKTGAKWKEFVRKTELVFMARFHMLKSALLEDFDPFDPNKEVPAELPEAKLQMLEDRFFSNFRHMLEKGNFEMLSQEQFETASSHDFLNTVPIEPELLKMDPVFKRYMEAHPELSEVAFEGSTRIWMFHRGVGVSEFDGRLVMQKIDSLMFQVFGRCCGKKKTAAQIEKEKEAEKLLKEGPTEEKQGVQRITVRSLCSKEGWKTLLKSSHIQEPTFKEIVLAYRINQDRDAFYGSENPRCINVKIFRDIPHADLEVLYPCKKTAMRPLDTVKFVGAGIGGLVSILMQQMAGELAGYTALTGFLTLAVSVLFDYQYHQSLYEQTTLRELYQKSKDSDRGAITYLMEQVGLQEVKETFLSYFFLVQEDKPMSQDEMDDKVEQFLSELQVVFGHRESKVDFEADDAIDKLLSMNLVEESDPDENGTRRYIAVPLDDGIDELAHQWSLMINKKH